MSYSETDWAKDQEWEREWHGNCVNSINEELKQMVYAKKMGIKFTPDLKTPYNIDMQKKSVLDIGGGAYSMLLKAINFSEAYVVDPEHYPEWTYARYEDAGIKTITLPAEKLDYSYFKDTEGFDEVWMYNVLQHTMNPETIIQNALSLGKIVRIFEWIDQGISKGHPQDLKEDLLNQWLGGVGKTEYLNETGCVGKSYYGIFKGYKYES